MTIEWSTKCSTNTGTFDLILQCIVEGKTVPATLTHQAVTLHGFEACQRIAEQKLNGHVQSGDPLQQVEVSEEDFTK